MQRRTRRRSTTFGFRARQWLHRQLGAASAFFGRLNARGRAILIGAAGLMLTGIILLIALPGSREVSAKTVTETPAPINLARTAEAPEGAADAAAELMFAPTPSPSPTPEPTPTPDPTLQKGMEGDPRIAELQQRLMELGYMEPDEPTLLFGSITEGALELFQRQHGLQQDGIAGNDTLNMIYSGEAKHYTLLEGFEGTDVENFQEQLKDLGYLSKATGYYGTETIEAVKSFQKVNGLSQDGKAGEKTFNLINSDDAKAHPNKAKEERRKANISKMIDVAKSKLGCKYVLGAQGPERFDCSGLVYYCLKQAGSNRRRLNAAGYSGVSDWEKISSLSTSKLQKGDLLFFYNNAKTKVGHVGIYIGGGEMIDASSSNGKVVRRSCLTNYWKTHFVCARRPW